MFTNAIWHAPDEKRAMNTVAHNPDSPSYSYISCETLDAGDHAACLTNWNQRYDQLSAGQFFGLFEEFRFGNIQLFRERVNQSLHQTGQAWRGSRTFAVPFSIETAGCFCGEVYDAHSMLTLSGDDQLDFRTPRHLEILACTTDLEALNSYALHVEHRDLEAELAGRQATVLADPKGIKALAELMATIMASLRATPELLSHVQMSKAIEQALFATLLDTLSPTTNSSLPSASSKSRKMLVERSRAYMEAHIDEPITIADLSIELGVSRRTLQYSFQEVLDLNPVKYLRAIRLNGVRRALKSTTPNVRKTVADIAANWGFWHLSHFSTEYKALFGELPSETLKRSG